MKNYGLQFKKIEPDHYYLGGGFIGTEVIQPDGQWDGFLPPEEVQNAHEVETMNCTIFGSINMIEILFNKLFHEIKSFSERYSGVIAGTTENGNDPHTALEAIRKAGLIDDNLLPFDESIKSWDNYYSPKPMTKHYLNIGKEFLRQYEFKHEWVFRDGVVLEEKIRLIKEALKRSPVCVSVYAWAADENNVYYKAGQENHWTCIYGYNQHGWKIFDSYTNSYKLYSFDADITYAKLGWLKQMPQKKVNPLLSFWYSIFGRNY